MAAGIGVRESGWFIWGAGPECVRPAIKVCGEAQATVEL